MDLEKYAGASSATQDDLAQVTKLGQSLVDKKAEVEAMEATIGSIKAEIRELEERVLPEAMDELNLASIELSNGAKITVKDFVRANITKKNEEAAFAWLRENGHADLIKRSIQVKLTRGEDNVAGEIIGAIKNVTDQPVEDKAAVPWNSLTAFVKEQLKAGKQIPMDLLGVHAARKAELK